MSPSHSHFLRSEVTPFLGQIVQTGTELIKYDLNYAGGEDDEDAEVADADEDDEDTSYRIRRSATKLLAALIETRPEMLTSLYKDVSPVLIQRFGDRDETVRLEVWATYGALLAQTRVYGGISRSAEFVDSPGVGGKRKRSPSVSDGMDVEVLESPAALLKGQVPSFAKALLGWSIAKSPRRLQLYCKQHLHSVLKQSPTTSSILLHTTCLSFLTAYFSTHDRAVLRLCSGDTDADVRSRAEIIIGDFLWICATDVVRTKGGQEWEVLCRTIGRTESAVQVVSRVATEVDIDIAWVNSSIEWVLGVLRRAGKSGKSDTFACLEVLLKKFDDGVPPNLVASIVEQMKPYISTNDIALLSHALSEYLKDIYNIAHSTLLSGASLEALLLFFARLVEADTEIATHVVPNLTIPLQKQKKGEASYSNVAKCIGIIIRCHPSLAAGTIAEFSKGLGIISPATVSQTLLLTLLKQKGGKATTSQIVLVLLVLGEIGRTM